LLRTLRGGKATIMAKKSKAVRQVVPSFDVAATPDTVAVYRVVMMSDGRAVKVLATSMDGASAMRFAADLNESWRQTKDRLVVLPPSPNAPKYDPAVLSL
jgi:hypothetical protein